MPPPHPDQQTILFLAASPKGRQRLDQELRDIAEGLQRAQRRDRFNLQQRWAVRPRDIQRAMLDLAPQIIHFSGSGEQGLVFEDDIGNSKPVDEAALAALFELFADQITCVVLNGCYSEVQAKAIAQHIPYVIGMSQTISAEAAIAFSVGFYDALGADRPIEFAYKLGCTAIQLEGMAEHLTPVLLKQSSEGATIQPKPEIAVNQPKLSRFQQLELERWKTELSDCERDYKAVVAQLRLEGDAPRQNQLKAQLSMLGLNIDQLEQQIHELEP